MFFTKKEILPQQISRNANDVISSIVSKEMRVTGEISFKGKARIDGIVEGNIKGEHLVLSQTGKVYGDLELVSLICHGSIEGNVKAQQLTMHSTAALHGNLAAVSLTVEPGAKLNGEITASSQQQAGSQPTPSTPKPEAPVKQQEKS